jgi:protein-S-isoprenylcysteine O-methyltransferase Ste14
MPQHENNLTTPKSPTSIPINLVGLASVLGTLLFIRSYSKPLPLVYMAIICLAVYAVTIIVLEFVFLKTYRNVSTGLDFSIKPRWDLERACIKLLGFYFTLFIIAFSYWLLQEYHGSFYNHYWLFLKTVLPILLVLAIPYFIIIDSFMLVPKDGYWHIVMFAFGRWKQVDYNVLKQHLLGWMVKAFFLPLMFTYCVDNINYFKNLNIATVTDNFKNFYDFSFAVIFGIDVLCVTAGYCLTIRLFDSHIRSTEPTILGWFVALECYQPFWSFFSGYYFKYDDNLYWGDWLSGHPSLSAIWGCSILFLVAVYVYATIPFGIRFSNLTNRGILTNGPYRFCKHPAYVSKNLSWWLISIPFISSTGALRLSCLLLCVNFIYFLRARTEERHLSKDSSYIEYATAMNELSIFAWIGKLLPILKYKPHKLFNL